MCNICNQKRNAYLTDDESIEVGEPVVVLVGNEDMENDRTSWG